MPEHKDMLKKKVVDEEEVVTFPIFHSLIIPTALLSFCDTLNLNNRWEDVTDDTLKGLLFLL